MPICKLFPVRVVLIAEVLLAGIVLGSCGPVLGQTAHFGSFETTVVPSGLRTNHNVAVDANGNVYVPDTWNHRVLKVSPSAGGYTQTTIGSGWQEPWGVTIDRNGVLYLTDTGLNELIKLTPTSAGYTQTTIASGFNSPQGLAVDAAGNLYIADGGNNQVVKETLSGSTYTASVIVTGLGNPGGVAVDSYGNLYIADTNNYRLLLETLSGGTYVQSVFSVPGLDMPFGVSVDQYNNVYVVDTYHNKILMETLVSAGTYVQSAIPTSQLYYPDGVAIDNAGNVYIADDDNSRVIKETLSGVNFGSVNIGSTSAAQSLNFVIDTAGTLGAMSVLTRGAQGLDFNNANTGTCAAGTKYAAAATCSVNVTFTPTASGVRYGAAVLRNSAGAAIATAYVYGSGSGPQINFLPGVQSTVLASGLNGAFGVATDGSGNVYIADAHNYRVLKETPSAAGYTATTIVGGNQYGPYGLAVDGGGNVYVADYNNSRIVKVSLSGSTYVQTTIATNLLHPYGVAVDGSGDVYVADTNNLRIVKETLVAGSYVQSVVPTSSLDDPYGVAVDASGNVYLVDTWHNRALKETLSGSSYTESVIGSGLQGPGAIAVDGNGNVYIADTYNLRIVKETPAGSGYTQSTVMSGGLTLPLGVSVDGNGNVYAADYSANLVLKQDLADAPSITFATTTSGMESSAQTVTVENIGNAALTFPVPSTGTNPSVAAGFILSTGGVSDCAQVAAGGASAATLAAGAECQLPIVFAPQGGGSVSGSLVVTDNALNAAAPAYAAQTIALSGTAAKATPTIAWTAPAAISYGTALSGTQLNASANIAGSFSYTPTANTVLSAGTGALSVIFTPTDSTDYTTATASVSLTVNQAAQAISFAAPQTPVSYGIAPIALSATGGGSGLPVTFGVSGPATLSGSVLTVTGAGTVVVTANEAGNSNYLAAAAVTQSIVVNRASSSSALTAATNTPTQTQADLLTTTVTGMGSITGSVVFTSGATTFCTAAVNASGVATCSFTPTSVGSVTVNAQYQGDANHLASSASLALTVKPLYDAAVSLQAASTALVYPGATNLTVCVMPATKAAATGTVQILDGAALLTTVALGGDGCAYWYIAPGLNAGTHSLAASYSGDANNAAGASAPTTITVSPVPVSLAVAAGSTSFPYGVGFHATVTASSNAGPPVGAIAYSLDGGAAVSVALSAGNAKVAIPAPSLGSHNVVVTFAQQTNYAAAAAQSVTFSVTSDPVIVTLSPSTASAIVGTSISFVAAVTSSVGGAPDAIGSVSFYDGSTLLATTAVNAIGQATYSSASLTAGTHNITATYSSSGQYASGTGGATVTLEQTASTTKLSAVATSLTLGQSAQLTATVTGFNPTGTVVFTAAGATLCTSVLSAGGATCTFTPEASGGLSVTAKYQGDANNASSAAKITLGITGSVDSAITVQFEATTLVYPGATNATVCVAPAKKSAATGTVAIFSGLSLLTTQTLAGNGCAYWYVTPALAAGSYSITAAYSGDKNNPAGVSGATTIVVDPAPVSLAIASGSTSIPFGVSYHATVTASSNGGTPTGLISYSLDGAAPVSVALSGNNAKFAIALPAVGSHQVVVAYAQQGNYAAAVSQTLNFNVAPAPVTVTLSPSLYSAEMGTTINFAVSINSSSAGAPNATGSVSILDGSAVLSVAAVNAEGQANFATAALAPGTHTITASYSGSASYGTGSNSVTITVTP